MSEFVYRPFFHHGADENVELVFFDFVTFLFMQLPKNTTTDKKKTASEFNKNLTCSQDAKSGHVQHTLSLML